MLEWTKLISIGRYNPYMSSHVPFKTIFWEHQSAAFETLKIRKIQVQFSVNWRCFGIAEINTTIIAYAMACRWRFLYCTMRVSQVFLKSIWIIRKKIICQDNVEVTVIGGGCFNYRCIDRTLYAAAVRKALSHWLHFFIFFPFRIELEWKLESAFKSLSSLVSNLFSTFCIFQSWLLIRLKRTSYWKCCLDLIEFTNFTSSLNWSAESLSCVSMCCSNAAALINPLSHFSHWFCLVCVWVKPII